MAFCTACGTKLNDVAAFCTSCGAAIGGLAAATSSAGATPAIAVAVPTAVQARAPAVPGNGGALKIVLIALAAVVVVGAVFVGTVGFRVHRADWKPHIDVSSRSTTLTAPFFQATIYSGIEVYPGAKPVKSDSLPCTGDPHCAEFESGDSLDQVAGFYRNRYPPATFSGDRAGQAIVATDGVITNEGLMFVTIVGQESRPTRIMIRQIVKE